MEKSNKKSLTQMSVFLVVAMAVTLLFSCQNNIGNVYKENSIPDSGYLPENSTAKVRLDISSDQENSKEYESFQEAWSVVNSVLDKDITMTVFSDWIGNENGFGKGDGYGSGGELKPCDRASPNVKLVINLNGYSIYREHNDFVPNGNVFNIDSTGYYILCNGTITGGKSTTKGGGIYLSGDNTTLVIASMLLTNNECATDGGGVYCAGGESTLIIEDSTILGNTSKQRGGGVYIDITSDMDNKYADVTLAGVVKIFANTSLDDTDNLVLGTHDKTAVKLKNISWLEDSSAIHVNSADGYSCIFADNITSSKKAWSLANYFFSDNTKCEIGVVADITYKLSIEYK